MPYIPTKVLWISGSGHPRGVNPLINISDSSYTKHYFSRVTKVGCNHILIKYIASDKLQMRVLNRVISRDRTRVVRELPLSLHPSQQLFRP